MAYAQTTMPMHPTLTVAEIDLLDAAFLDHFDAISAWQRWRAGVDWAGHLDGTSFALLPLVYRNLRRLGVDDPLFSRFKGVGRQAWLANQRLIAGLQPTLAAWNSAGVEPLLLPPTLQLLWDSSVVPDRRAPTAIAVRPAQAERAVRCLLDCGWRPLGTVLPRWCLTGYTCGARHLSLRQEHSQPLMLTWGLDWWFGERVDAVWGCAGEARLGGQAVLTLDRADALAFELGQPVGDQLFQRIADVLKISSHQGTNWGRLGDAARHRPLAPDWCDTLAQVRSLLYQWGAPPDLPSWCAAVSSDPSVPPPRRAGVLLRSYADWRAYRGALGVERGRAEALIQLPGYLMGRWKVATLGELPVGLWGWLRQG